MLTRLLVDYFGCPAPNLEFETLTPANLKETAVSCHSYAEAVGKADSLLVPQSTPLPLRPFEALALADLPQPIGRNGAGRPSVITMYDTRRRIMLTIGVYDEPSRKSPKWELCV